MVDDDPMMEKSKPPTKQEKIKRAKIKADVAFVKGQ
jgi:hypothetical protein